MSGNSRFKRLLEPYHIGPVKTRNRMIKTASGTSFWDPGEHRISEKGKAPEIYAIGDGWEPRLIPDAVADGWQVANSI